MRVTIHQEEAQFNTKLGDPFSAWEVLLTQWTLLALFDRIDLHDRNGRGRGGGAGARSQQPSRRQESSQ